MYLKKHIDSVHGNVWYICNQCDYKSKRKCNLKKHIDSVHGGVRHSCDQCDYKTKRKVAIKRHTDSVHGGVRYSVNHNTTVKANMTRDLKCTKEKKIQKIAKFMEEL